MSHHFYIPCETRPFHYPTCPGIQCLERELCIWPKPHKVISEEHGRNWGYIWWASVLASGSSNPQICCLTLAMNTAFCVSFRRTLFHDGSWNCNYYFGAKLGRGEKRSCFFIFWVFFYPQYLLSKIAFQVNSWWAFFSFCFLKCLLCLYHLNFIIFILILVAYKVFDLWWIFLESCSFISVFTLMH